MATNIVTAPHNRISITVDASKILKAAQKLREMGFDHVKSVTGVDYPEQDKIEVLYHVSAFEDLELAKAILEIRTSVNRSDPKIQSLIDVWPSVEYLERETSDLLGVTFEGQPTAGKLMLPESYADLPPLRKDFKIKTEGIDA